MSVPDQYNSLGSAFRRLPDLEKTSGASAVPNKQEYQHPFSRELGLELKSLRRGFAGSEQTTNGKQINNRQLLHAAVPYSAAISTMAAVADSSMTDAEIKSSVAVALHTGLSFIKTIFPGDKLEILARLDTTQKNLRYISADILRTVGGSASEIVAKAISIFAVTPKDKLGLSSL